MTDVWMPVVELTSSDPFELAEKYKNDFDDNHRVVIDELENVVYIERQFNDGDGGFVEIGTEANPGEDYAEPIIEAVKALDRDDVRLVFDFNRELMVLETWVEPS